MSFRWFFGFVGVGVGIGPSGRELGRLPIAWGGLCLDQRRRLLLEIRWGRRNLPGDR